MAAPIQADTSAFTSDNEVIAASPAPVTETASTEDAATLHATDDAPTSRETPASSVESAEPEQDADGEWGFRSLKTGQFTKASRKDAVRELRHRVNTLTARLKTQPAAVPTPSPATPSAAAATAAPTSVEPSGKPKFEDYQSDADPLGAWIEAVADWKAESALSKREQAIQAEKQKSEYAKATAQLSERVAKFEEEHDDLQEVVSNPDFKVSDVMRAVFDTHEQGPELAYYLGTHLKDSLRLAKLSQFSPVNAESINEMVESVKELQSRSTSAAPTGSASAAGRSSAPRPLTPVRTGRPARDDGPPDPASSSLDDHIRYYNAKDEGKRRRRA